MLLVFSSLIHILHHVTEISIVQTGKYFHDKHHHLLLPFTVWLTWISERNMNEYVRTHDGGEICEQHTIKAIHEALVS